MTVIRSAYRQILRLGSKASRAYADPNDLCFAVFGVMLRRSEFAAAGYGESLQSIAHACFARPSIDGLSQDTVAARLAASFAILRTLSEVVKHSTENETVRERTREILRNGQLATSDDEKEHATTPSTPPPPPPAPAASDGEPVASSTSSLTEAERQSQRDDEVLVGGAVVFLERTLQRKVQKFSRHVVLCRDQTRFPPYAFLLPPEPLYPLNLRQEFAFPLMVDALHCMAAQSRRMPAPPPHPNTPKEAVPTSEKRVAPETTPLLSFMSDVPTRTTLRSDFLDVEVFTEYVCANPHQTSSTGEVDAAAAASAATAAPTPTSPSSPPSSSPDGVAGVAHLFLYHVFIRNRDPTRGNPERWHAQVVSHHLVVFDVERRAVVEMVRPGVVGNFPLLAPGESHTFESGTSLLGGEGILRGTIQLNAFSEAGDMRTMDVAIAPTRLSILQTATDAHLRRPADHRYVESSHVKEV